MRNCYSTLPYVVAFCFIVSCSVMSCTSSKKVKYFQDIPDSGQLKTIQSQKYTDLSIRPEDVLTIVIQTVDPTATASINLGNVPTTGNATQAGVSNFNQIYNSGYLVDKEGYVELSVLGKFKAEGYTTGQLKDTIAKRAAKFYKDPTVVVRFANFKVSVAGEVTKPGVYILPNERVSILDILANAGDLTIFGKRENVLLLRENKDGTKTPYRINLKNSNLMNEPYFYLRQNDYIYVEPSPGKVAVNDAQQTRNITIISGALSVLIILLTRLK